MSLPCVFLIWLRASPNVQTPASFADVKTSCIAKFRVDTVVDCTRAWLKAGVAHWGLINLTSLTAANHNSISACY